MRKGFTLVEMLGIITVLAVMLLVTFPALSKSIKQIQTNNSNNFYNSLRISAEAYVGINQDRFPELDTPGGIVEVKIQELYDSNLLKDKNNNFSLNSKVTIESQGDGTYKFYFNDEEI